MSEDQIRTAAKELLSTITRSSEIRTDQGDYRGRDPGGSSDDDRQGGRAEVSSEATGETYPRDMLAHGNSCHDSKAAFLGVKPEAYETPFSSQISSDSSQTFAQAQISSEQNKRGRERSRMFQGTGTQPRDSGREVVEPRTASKCERSNGASIHVIADRECERPQSASKGHHRGELPRQRGMEGTSERDSFRMLVDRSCRAHHPRQ
jgi:hypothetical protein